MPGIFTSQFDLGERVVLLTDPDELERIVTSVRFPLGGGAIYQLNCGTEAADHYPEEMRRAMANAS